MLQFPHLCVKIHFSIFDVTWIIYLTGLNNSNAYSSKVTQKHSAALVQVNRSGGSGGTLETSTRATEKSNPTD